MQKRGFTLIELLVVIVIIGILATISVATFSGYFQRARDAERQAVVRNAATLIKTSRAVNGITSYVFTDAAAVRARLASEGGYAVPAANASGYNYAYIYQNADANGYSENFVVVACSEADQTDNFVDGTAAGVALAPACTASDHNPADATVTGYTVLQLNA